MTMYRLACGSLIFLALAGSSALAQEKIVPSAELFSTMTNMRLQLDNLSKTIPSAPANTKAIYKNLDDQFKDLVKSIYFDDDRRNYLDVSPIEQRASEASFLFVRQGHLTPEAQTGMWSLPEKTAGLCTPEQIAKLNKNRPTNGQYQIERFYDEPAPGFCSGFKVGKDLPAG